LKFKKTKRLKLFLQKSTLLRKLDQENNFYHKREEILSESFLENNFQLKT